MNFFSDIYRVTSQRGVEVVARGVEEVEGQEPRVKLAQVLVKAQDWVEREWVLTQVLLTYLS